LIRLVANLVKFVDVKYNKINNSDIAFFGSVVGTKNVTIDNDDLNEYSHDETEDLSFLPEIVVKPFRTSEVSAILKYCNNRLIPVTVSGGKTGLSGGCIPLHKGVALSMSRFNKIIEIDTKNLQATVEPGVINQNFRDAVEEKGLFYPPDPASKGSCQLGGNLAENAGGPKALKYGVTKDYVLNLEIVLTSGEVVMTGANVLKNSTGYNLTQLMIGSEGTLAVITKIVFKLIPKPIKDITMLVPFYCIEEACKSVSKVFSSGLNPSALEFMERDAIDWTIRFSDISMMIEDGIEAHLLIEFDGNDTDVLYENCQKTSALMSDFKCGDILIADSQRQKDQLWMLRRKISEAVKSNSVYKEEDTVVPRAKLPDLIKGVKTIGMNYGFKSVCYGHAGDGNLHVNIIKGSMKDEKWNTDLHDAIREIFTLTKNLGGTISGEHGIGLVQKEFIDIVLSEKNIQLQKGIKRLFDPNNILNPGKIFY